MRRFLWIVLLTALPLGAAEPGLDEKLDQFVALDATLRDEAGQPVTLRSLIDRPTILTLNYFRCAGICTPLLNGVVDVVNRIELTPGKDFQVLTVSFDDRDTPEIAATKRENFLKQVKRPMEPTAWRFLTGDAPATKAVCDSVGFGFERKGEDFIHPGVIMILSPQGKITRYLYGTTFLPFDVQMAVGEASKGLARPSVSKLLQFCYSYDPQGRRYAFDFVKVGGIVTLAFAGGFLVALLLVRGKRGAKPTEKP